MNVPAQGWGGTVTQCRCAHCGEMYASNYIHTCDPQPAKLWQQTATFWEQYRNIPETEKSGIPEPAVIPERPTDNTFLKP